MRSMVPLRDGTTTQHNNNKPIEIDEVETTTTATTTTSPFDNVPGFKKNSLNFSNKGKTEELAALSDSARLANHEECVVEISTSCSGRSNWIRFEEESSVLDVNATDDEKIASHDEKTPVEEAPSSTRKTWVLLETPTPSVKVEMHENDDELTTEECFDDKPAAKLLKDVDGSKDVRKSIEDLLDVVNKTVTSLKENITKPRDNVEGKSLIVDPYDDDAVSEFSDEVISLDYESEEETKKLRDTPVKKFTDVSLFQATSVVKGEKPRPSSNGERQMKSEVVVEIEPPKTLDDYPPKVSKNSWEFWCRHPTRKKKVGSRKWASVKVTVDGEFVRLAGTTKTGAEIDREIPLHPFFVFTIPTSHKGDKDGKVHSVKLQYVKYKETRRFHKGKRVIEHAPAYSPVLKIASRNILALKEFITSVDSVIRNIPTYRDKDIMYRYQEIYIDSEDNCDFLMNGDGEILLYNVTVHVRLRVFVTGNPELKLLLNDTKNKEILSKARESLSRVTKPPTNWVTPQYFEYHPCVDELKSKREGGIIFSPPDGYSFELLRFRVSRSGVLPLTCKSTIELLSSGKVQLNACVQVTGDTKTIRYKRNGVRLYFPVPASWGDLFVRGMTLKGVKQYLKVKGCKKAPVSRTKSTNHVSLQLGVGEASYDPSLGAVVWKLGSLPIIRGGLAADASHTLQCTIELPSTCRPRDEEFERYAYVEFNISQPFASGVSIEEVLLSDGTVPDKWVCYRANYVYKIRMNVKDAEKM